MLQNAPLSVLIYASGGFMSYSSGIFSCGNTQITTTKLNHAVQLIGYDTNGNYIIKNSWGKSWGKNGIGIVNKNSDCGISMRVYSFEGGQ